MVSAIDIALSGLNAASKKIETSARNIANMHSTKSRIDGQTVNQPYFAQVVDLVSLSTGGVLATQNTASVPTQTIFNPGDPAANPDGTVAVPNVDLADELVSINIASHSFKANLSTIRTQDRITQSLLDIFS